MTAAGSPGSGAVLAGSVNFPSGATQVRTRSWSRNSTRARAGGASMATTRPLTFSPVTRPPPMDGIMAENPPVAPPLRTDLAPATPRAEEIPVNRRDLVNAIAAHSGTDSKTVDGVLRGFTDVVTATVAKGDPVVLTGFAKFAKIQTKARMGRNPATGEAIKIKASKKARITPLKGFKDSVMTPSQAPKLAKGVWPPAPAAAPAEKPTAKAPANNAPAKKATTARNH